MSDDLCTKARTVDQKLGLGEILTFKSNDSSKNQCAAITRPDGKIHAEMTDAAGCKRTVDIDKDGKVKVTHQLKPAQGQSCTIQEQKPAVTKVQKSQFKEANDYLDSQETCKEGETCYLPPSSQPAQPPPAAASAPLAKLFKAAASYFLIS